jgi:hypothetical protein
MKPVAHEFLVRAADDLTTAARNYHRRRRRNRRLAIQASFVVIAMSVVAIVASQHGAQAGPLQITVTGGIVEIAVLDPAAPIAKVEKLLGDANIPWSVDAIATGPSRAEHIVGLRGISSIGAGPLSVRIPVGSRLILVVGRAARPGEAYGAATDAFAEGEPLACLGGKGADAPVLAARVPAGVIVRWRDSRTSKSLAVSDLEGRRVEMATASSPTDVLVYAASGKGDRRTNWCR